jgi:hypothetical protein
MYIRSGVSLYIASRCSLISRRPTVLAYTSTCASSLDGRQWAGSAKDKYTSAAWFTVVALFTLRYACARSCRDCMRGFGSLHRRSGGSRIREIQRVCV